MTIFHVIIIILVLLSTVPIFFGIWHYRNNKPGVEFLVGLTFGLFLSAVVIQIMASLLGF